MVRRGGDFFLGRVQAAPAISGLSLAGPGIAVLPDGRGIKAAYWDGNPPGWQDVGKDEAFVDGDLLAWPLSIRSRRPGDRFHPLGLQGGKKVKEVLIEAKIPRESRNAVPLVVDGSGRVIWLAGLRADQRFRITAETRHILHLTLGARELPLCD
jgi:tRNA(Ile)-lysidine synthase